jgi:hypothetical protein
MGAFAKWLNRMSAPAGLARLAAKQYLECRAHDPGMTNAEICYAIARMRYLSGRDARHRAFMNEALLRKDGTPIDIGLQDLCALMIATENRWGSNPERPEEAICDIVYDELVRAGIPSAAIKGDYVRWYW